LNVDGQNASDDGFICRNGSHHLRFIGNSIRNTGASGIASIKCDYLTSDHNVIFHDGYGSGWTSGISYNSDQWYDTYAGFHNIISNNIVVGEFDNSSNHTDGNGIILDLSNGTYTCSSADTPPVLIINNVVYGNGGRCIEAFTVTNFWVVNNTCYNNGLDLTMNHPPEFDVDCGHDGFFINNIASAWTSSNNTFLEESSVSNLAYYRDLYYRGSVSSSYSDKSQFINADPLFVNPPAFNPTAGGQYATALDPLLLGNGLTLQPTSPAIDKGIDPTTLSGLSSAITNDLKKYVYTDVTGKTRPQGAGFDLGAYECK
jgi:serralysin